MFKKKLNRRASLALAAVLFSGIFGVDACYVVVSDKEKVEIESKAGYAPYWTTARDMENIYYRISEELSKENA